MKKGLILAALCSLTALTGCSLTPNTDGIVEPDGSGGTTINTKNALKEAIRLLNVATIFLDSDIDFDMSFAISFNNGSSLSIDDLQFESSNKEVLNVENHVLKTKGQGSAFVTITSSKLEGSVEQQFYVGSIDGNYSFSRGTFSVNLSLNESKFDFSVTAGNYHSEAVKDFSGKGSYYKAGCFLFLDFEGSKPTQVVSLYNAISSYVGNYIDADKITESCYGLLDFANDAISIKMTNKDASTLELRAK